MALDERYVLHAVLFGVDEGEDMIFRAIQHTLQDSQVGHHTARVEVLRTIEDDFVAFGSDFEITVARVHGASNELQSHQQ